MYNGVKKDGVLYKAWYMNLSGSDSEPYPIAIYASTYKRFPTIEGLVIKNDTDSMTDYFEKDRILVRPDSKHYNDVLAAYHKQQEKRAKLQEKREAKRKGA